MKKITLSILIVFVLGSCSTTTRVPTIAELVAKTYPSDTYISSLHPSSDSAMKARWASFLNHSK